MQEKQMTEQESLLVIQQMINRAKNDFVDTGIGPILWGSVIAFCSLVQAAMIHFDFSLPFDIWLLAIVAIIPQIYISVREKKARKAKGWNDDIMSYIWLCFGIGVFVINFINNAQAHTYNPVLNHYKELTGTSVPHVWTYATCYLMFVYGFPTIVTGAARNFKLMTFGGILCWVFAIVAAFTATKVDFLLMAIAATCAWLIPGIILERNYRLQKRRNV